MESERRGPPDKSAKRFSIFGPNDDSRVPGEALVELKPEAARRVTVSIPDASMLEGTGVKQLGLPDLDEALQDIHVRSISHLYLPSPPTLAGHTFVAEVGEESHFRIQYDPATSIDEALATLTKKGNRDVLSAEPNHWRQGMTAGSRHGSHHPRQWGLPKIDCPTAWQRTIGDANVVVAVLDTGVDLNHPDLRPHLVAGKNCVAFDVRPTPPDGYVLLGNYTGASGPPEDEVGHGTHVAGTISCERTSMDGVAGVTWRCGLMPVRVLARAYEQSTREVVPLGTGADTARGIRWAVNNGAKIVNMSLGDYDVNPSERSSIEYAVQRNVVVVAAVGNDGRSDPTYPAALPGVIAVAATEPQSQLASFSNFGDHVSVCAPGVKIRSTYWGGGSYTELSGTSTASPHVTGVAALLLSLNLGLTASDVTQIILGTATPLRKQPADPVPNPTFGRGLVNAEAALQRALGL
ncbi:S8 family serine peptidase [Kitasatospora hibisci]|uniref:S8 family serine peptidase n=1 Tax=Kitasatospora hibisci TaxID=3369522 RepID=UPI0037547EC4